MGGVNTCSPFQGRTSPRGRLTAGTGREGRAAEPSAAPPAASANQMQPLEPASSRSLLPKASRSAAPGMGADEAGSVHAPRGLLYLGGKDNMAETHLIPGKTGCEPSAGHGEGEAGSVAAPRARCCPCPMLQVSGSPGSADRAVSRGLHRSPEGNHGNRP